jgi:hypothetical protein
VMPLAALAGACGLDKTGLEPIGGGNGESDAEVAQGMDASSAMGSDGGSPPSSNDANAPTNEDGGTTTGSSDGAVEATIIDGCSTVENCDNGIDDNCNGLIDCADPMCSAWTCAGTAPVPAGWTLVELSMSASGTCQTGYATPAPLYTGTFSPAMCGCSAEVATPGSCTSGNVDVSAGPGCVGFDAGGPGGSGACSAFGAGHDFTPPAGSQIEVTAAPYVPGTCTATPTKTVPPIPVAGQTCALAGSSGSGCMNGAACVPALSNGAKLCIAHGGTIACPTGIGFDKAQPSYEQEANDTRGCAGCSALGPTASCQNPTLTVYTDPMCDGGAQPVPANGSCQGFPGAGPMAPTYQAARYTATVANELCVGSGGATEGTVTFADEVTLCCH